jgi:hypothetical protein
MMPTTPEPEAKLFWDNFGDVRCAMCMPGKFFITGPEDAGYEPIIEADLRTLGELSTAFGRDFGCECGRVVWNNRTQVLEQTS